MNIQNPTNFILFNNQLINTNSIESIPLFPSYTLHLSNQSTPNSFSLNHKDDHTYFYNIIAKIYIKTNNDAYSYKYSIKPPHTIEMFQDPHLFTIDTFTPITFSSELSFKYIQPSLNTNFLNHYNTTYQKILIPIFQILNYPYQYPNTMNIDTLISLAERNEPLEPTTN